MVDSIDIKQQDSSSQSSKPEQHRLSKVNIAAILFSFVAGFVGAGVAIAIFLSNGSFVSSPQVETKILTKDSEVIAEVAKELKPSVVSINTNVRNNSFLSRGSESVGAGTGLIISSDGLVVTNKHVVPENTSSITIIDSDGKSYRDVEVIDRDTVSDIAFLQVKSGAKFKPAKLGNSSDMKVGQRVIAIGNALGMFSNTVTSGIVSGVSRPIVASDDGNGNSQSLEDLIQTDASINPGNSGGPLVNLSGEVIGINTAVASNAENIGFAIPIDDIKPLFSSVEEFNEIRRPFIGVNFVTVNEAVANSYELKVNNGALVISPDGEQSGVLPDSPADKAGLEDGDVITKVGNISLDQTNSLVSAVNRYSIGEKIPIEFNRNGKIIKEQITLEKR